MGEGEEPASCCHKHKAYAAWCEACQVQYVRWRLWRTANDLDCELDRQLVPADVAPKIDVAMLADPALPERMRPKGTYRRRKQTAEQRWRALEMEIDRLTRSRD